MLFRSARQSEKILHNGTILQLVDLYGLIREIGFLQFLNNRDEMRAGAYQNGHVTFWIAFVSFADQVACAKNTIGPADACLCFRVNNTEAR